MKSTISCNRVAFEMGRNSSFGSDILSFLLVCASVLDSFNEEGTEDEDEEDEASSLVSVSVLTSSALGCGSGRVRADMITWKTLLYIVAFSSSIVVEVEDEEAEEDEGAGSLVSSASLVSSDLSSSEEAGFAKYTFAPPGVTRHVFAAASRNTIGSRHTTAETALRKFLVVMRAELREDIVETVDLIEASMAAFRVTGSSTMCRRITPTKEAPLKPVCLESL